MRFLFRPLTSVDAKAYRKIRLESLKMYPECFASTYEQQLKNPTLYFEKIIQEESSQGIMIGVIHGKAIVGICGMTFETKAYPKSGEIIQMYVDKVYQRNGLAVKLLDTLLIEARKK